MGTLSLFRWVIHCLNEVSIRIEYLPFTGLLIVYVFALVLGCAVLVIPRPSAALDTVVERTDLNDVAALATPSPFTNHLAVLTGADGFDDAVLHVIGLESGLLVVRVLTLDRDRFILEALGVGPIVGMLGCWVLVFPSWVYGCWTS